jgi:spore coat protein CotH
MKHPNPIIKQPHHWLFLSFLFSLAFFRVNAQNGNILFDDQVLHRVEFFGVDVSKISDPAFKGIYQPVTIKIDGILIDQVGLSTKGEKSYAAAQNDKKPFKVKTDKFISGQKYDGIKRFNLHNNTYDQGIISEKLTCEAARQP